MLNGEHVQISGVGTIIPEVKVKKSFNHQLQRTCDMRYIIEETKTEARKRKIPINEDVAQMFQAIIEDREPSKMEKGIDGHTGFFLQ